MIIILWVILIYSLVSFILMVSLNLEYMKIWWPLTLLWEVFKKVTGRDIAFTEYGFDNIGKQDTPNTMWIKNENKYKAFITYTNETHKVVYKIEGNLDKLLKIEPKIQAAALKRLTTADDDVLLESRIGWEQRMKTKL